MNVLCFFFYGEKGTKNKSPKTCEELPDRESTEERVNKTLEITS